MVTSASWTESSRQLLDQMGYASGFLFGPSLFLFCKSLTDNHQKMSLLDFTHGLPFVVFLIFSFSSYELKFVTQFMIFNIQVFAYLIICLLIVNRYRLRLKNYLSFTATLNLNWLYYVVGAFICMWGIDLINHLLMVFKIVTEEVYLFLSFISVFINFSFVIIIFYKALNQPVFLFDNKHDDEKYKASSLSKEEKQEIMKKVKTLFQVNQPFLEGTLTIKNVSESIGIPVKYLSQVINELEKMNFYDFINKYRIEHSKRLLKSNKTILEVLYEAGFNSKSAFNKAFKKHTGNTPSQFRKSV